jgi:oxygen-independent coproporphyrinogen-3 oxidase
VSTLGPVRRRNSASIGRYVAALAAGREPPHELEELDGATRAQERLMLGLRLDEPLRLEGLEGVIDGIALERLVAGELVELGAEPSGAPTMRLTRRGRFLGGGVTVELLA